MPQFQMIGAAAPAFTSLDAFTQGYVEALFFTEEESLAEQAGEDGGDAPYSQASLKGFEDLAPSTLAIIIDDCATFQRLCADDLALAYDVDKYGAATQAGHDFWLTRNHHGAGFWDGDLPKELGERLTGACKAGNRHAEDGFDEISVYLGNDGRVYAD